MNDSEAAERTRGGEAAMRQGLVELARQFLAEGLVVRTWGNFSARLDRDYFLVTPSGRSYETLQPADLVKCRIDSGDKVESEEQKPSSEAPMHALVYRERPAFNVLAHTHQVYASALSLSESPVLLDETGRKQLGADSVPVSPYGLPGTRRLHRHIAETLRETEASCLLMASHGAFIFGESGGDCLSRARTLEETARRLYEQRVGRCDHGRASIADSTEEEREAVSAARGGGFPAVAVSCDPELQLLLGSPMKAYLDDFAQICGVNIGRRRKKNNVFFVPEKKIAVCFAENESEALNVRAVLEKNVRACHMALLSGAKPLAGWESRLMRLIYQKKYSKRAERR